MIFGSDPVRGLNDISVNNWTGIVLTHRMFEIPGIANFGLELNSTAPQVFFLLKKSITFVTASNIVFFFFYSHRCMNAEYDRRMDQNDFGKNTLKNYNNLVKMSDADL